MSSLASTNPQVDCPLTGFDPTPFLCGGSPPQPRRSRYAILVAAPVDLEFSAEVGADPIDAGHPGVGDLQGLLRVANIPPKGNVDMWNQAKLSLAGPQHRGEVSDETGGEPRVIVGDGLSGFRVVTKQDVRDRNRRLQVLVHRNRDQQENQQNNQQNSQHQSQVPADGSASGLEQTQNDQQQQVPLSEGELEFQLDEEERRMPGFVDCRGMSLEEVVRQLGECVVPFDGRVLG